MELLEERANPVRAEAAGAQPRRVCFVCTGNTCRSPMAEAVANAIIKAEGRTDLRVFSAGLCAAEGDPITPYAVRVLEEAEIPAVSGHDYHRHVAHSLLSEEADAFDLLVGLTEHHAMQMMMRFPEAAEKITSMPTPIADPWGGDVETYRECLAQIRKGVLALLFPEGTA